MAMMSHHFSTTPNRLQANKNTFQVDYLLSMGEVISNSFGESRDRGTAEVSNGGMVEIGQIFMLKIKICPVLSY